MVQKGEATAKKSLLGSVATATAHTLRPANQALRLASLALVVCVIGGRAFINVVGSGRGWRNDGGCWGAGDQSRVGLPALPSTTVWEMDSLAK